MKGPTTLASEEERLLACVHCGFCLPACPTYLQLGDESDSPRGRLHLMRAVAEGRIEPDASAFLTHIDRCLGCRACETACPSGVEYGYLLERAREVAASTAGIDLPTRLLLLTFGSRALTQVTLLGARLLRRVRIANLLLRIVPKGFARLRFGLAMLTATSPWQGLHELKDDDGPPAHPANSTPPPPGKSHRVALLRGCVQDGLFRRVNSATITVLEANGHEVIETRDERCCGALHAHAGEREKARALARANIEAFEALDAEYIVVNSAGCGAALKEYGRLLEDDEGWAERARRFRDRVRDLFELLQEEGARPGIQLRVRATYDAPCHLDHGQGLGEAPIRVLTQVTGIEPIPMNGADQCCGGAGIYGITHPELSDQILREKVAAIEETGAEIVVTPNPGCMMQIGAGLHLGGSTIPALHPVELMAESYHRES